MMQKASGFKRRVFLGGLLASAVASAVWSAFDAYYFVSSDVDAHAKRKASWWQGRVFGGARRGAAAPRPRVVDEPEEEEAPASGGSHLFAAAESLRGAQPAKEFAGDRTSFECVGGPSYENRSCLIHNVCYNTVDGKWSAYTGEAAPAGATGPLCIDTPTGPICHERTALLYCSLRYPQFCGFSPAVLPGPLPEDKVAHWYGGKAALFQRHQPMNYVHAMSDDFFGMHWLLKRHFGYGTVDYEKELDPGLEPSGPGDENWNITFIFQDKWGVWPKVINNGKVYRRYQRVAFYHDSQLKEMWAPDGGDRTLVCFKNIAVGAPGMTMHRNAGYGYHESRLIPFPLDDELYEQDQRDFIAFLIRRYGLPPADPLPPAKYPGEPRGYVVIVQRHQYRRILNIASLIHHLLPVIEGRKLIVAELNDMTDAQQAELFRGAELVISPHGAGGFNVVFMRPGALFLELIPPPMPRTSLFFRYLALVFGVQYDSLAFAWPDPERVASYEGKDAMNYDYDVDPSTTVATVDLYLNGGRAFNGRQQVHLHNMLLKKPTPTPNPQLIVLGAPF